MMSPPEVLRSTFAAVSTNPLAFKVRAPEPVVTDWSALMVRLPPKTEIGPLIAWAATTVISEVLVALPILRPEICGPMFRFEVLTALEKLAPNDSRMTCAELVNTAVDWNARASPRTVT